MRAIRRRRRRGRRSEPPRILRRLQPLRKGSHELDQGVSPRSRHAMTARSRRSSASGSRTSRSTGPTRSGQMNPTGLAAVRGTVERLTRALGLPGVRWGKTVRITIPNTQAPFREPIGSIPTTEAQAYDYRSLAKTPKAASLTPNSLRDCGGSSQRRRIASGPHDTPIFSDMTAGKRPVIAPGQSFFTFSALLSKTDCVMGSPKYSRHHSHTRFIICLAVCSSTGYWIAGRLGFTR